MGFRLRPELLESVLQLFSKKITSHEVTFSLDKTKTYWKFENVITPEYNSVLIENIVHSCSFEGSTFILRRVEQECLDLLFHYNSFKPGDREKKFPSRAEIKGDFVFSLVFDSEGLFKTSLWYIRWPQGSNFLIGPGLLNVENGAISKKMKISPQNYEMFTKLVTQRRLNHKKHLCVII